ncbi:MAG TPA: alpha/beta fold hydrolase [Chloroflexota bacterium]
MRRSRDAARGGVVKRGYLSHGPHTVYYQVAGEGKPVVLLHGLAGSTRWWAPTIAPLARAFRVYVIDLIHFGGSSSRQPFALNRAARLLIEWMDWLGVPRASIVGHSLGGHIAADLAADFPDRVDRLVLVDAAALPLERNLLRHALGLFQTLQSLPRNIVALLVLDALRAGPVAIWSAAHELLSADIRSKLPRIQAPTLIIWGERDALLPLDLGKRLAALLPRARLAVVDGAGHTPMLERPEAFNRLIVDFLAGDERCVGGKLLPR